MKKIAAVLAGVVCVVLLVWQCRSRGTSKPSTGTTDRATAGIQHGPHAHGDRPLPAWFAVRDVPARKIAGRVTLNGKPVAGADVSLQSVLTRAGFGVPVLLRTGADGTFDFGMRPAAQYDVTAATSTTVAAIAHVDLTDPTLKPPSDQLELRLHDCAASVEGTIYDASGNPLPKVHVRREGLVGVESDARGAYKLCVPWGNVELEYGADGYGTVLLTIDARGAMERDVVLVPDAAVLVRVVRDDDSAPVPDANVYVFPQEWGMDRPAPATAITKTDGRARIAGLVPGRYRIFALADGLRARSPVDALAELGSETETVVRLETMARISGKVMSGGKPIAGAHVAAVRKAPAVRSAPAVSQADGSFVLEQVPAGDLVFLAHPYAVSSPTEMSIEAGKHVEGVVLEVRAQGAIRGRVTRLGKPAEGVAVCCVQNAFAGMSPEAFTDAEGRYEFTGVPAGTYSIGAGADEVGAFALGTKVKLAAGEERTVDLELDMAGTIAGTVVDQQGKPVKGVFVRWIHEKTGDVGRSITDAQGHYRCGAMTGGGTYRAAVFPTAQLNVPFPTANGAPYPTVELRDGTTVIENVTLAIDRPDLTISGSVVDDGGAPVVDAVVKALPVPAGQQGRFYPWLRLPLTSTDDDGGFTLRGLAPGSYAVQGHAADGGEGVSESVAAGSTGVTVRITRPGRIEGTLVDFKQPPVIHARPIGPFAVTAGTVDGAAFHVLGLRPGRYLVNAQGAYEGDGTIVDVRAGQATHVTLTSHGRGVVEATVLDFRTRAPVANAACHVVMVSGDELGLTSWDPGAAPRSDERGRVTIDPAPAGDVGVECVMPAPRWSRPSAAVALSPGGHATVQLLSAELTTENPSSIGIEFDWRVITPRIAAVTGGGPAARAGLLAGDVVIAVDGASVAGLDGAGVQVLIESRPAGDDVRITVLRGAATKTVTVTAIQN